MQRILIAFGAIAVIAAAACSDSASAPSSAMSLTMSSAFSLTPAGYADLNSSYVGDEGVAFLPEFSRMGGPGPFGHGGPDRRGGPGFGLGFMGGGLFGVFYGDGFGRRNFLTDTSCHYASGTGVTTCASTHNGLTVTRTIRFQTSAGASQSAYDTATTNTVTTTSSVSGSVTRRGNSESTISSSSNQVVTGLASGSTQRTVNSTSGGTETTTGTSSQGEFTAKRATGDTVRGVVIPTATTTNRFPYPTAGSIIRGMSATVTISGQSPSSSSRREVITYDGS
ncbi:MAG TPA: hypothetical protein VIP11_26080, partial [Gemmatimonadaceae bacterium]